jgi:hypothetical protein
MRYLLNVTEVYRVPTVAEALAMRDEFSRAPEYEMNSFAYTTKFDKKTEEEYQIVKVKKTVQSEKNCTAEVNLIYEPA